MHEDAQAMKAKDYKSVYSEYSSVIEKGDDPESTSRARQIEESHPDIVKDYREKKK